MVASISGLLERSRFSSAAFGFQSNIDPDPSAPSVRISDFEQQREDYAKEPGGADVSAERFLALRYLPTTAQAEVVGVMSESQRQQYQADRSHLFPNSATAQHVGAPRGGQGTVANLRRQMGELVRV